MSIIRQIEQLKPTEQQVSEALISRQEVDLYEKANKIATGLARIAVNGGGDFWVIYGRSFTNPPDNTYYDVITFDNGEASTSIPVPVLQGRLLPEEYEALVRGAEFDWKIERTDKVRDTYRTPEETKVAIRQDVLDGFDRQGDDEFTDRLDELHELYKDYA